MLNLNDKQYDMYNFKSLAFISRGFFLYNLVVVYNSIQKTVE